MLGREIGMALGAFEHRRKALRPLLVGQRVGKATEQYEQVVAQGAGVGHGLNTREARHGCEQQLVLGGPVAIDGRLGDP